MTSNREAIEGLLEVGREGAAQAFADRERLAEPLERLRAVAWPNFEVVMVAPGGWGKDNVRSGVEGYEAAWQDWLEPFESFRLEFEDVVEEGDHVVVLVRQFGVPKGGGKEVQSAGAGVFEFREGRIARMEFHLDRDAAFRAAGIDPAAYSSQP